MAISAAASSPARPRITGIRQRSGRRLPPSCAETDATDTPNAAATCRSGTSERANTNDAGDRRRKEGEREEAIGTHRSPRVAGPQGAYGPYQQTSDGHLFNYTDVRHEEYAEAVDKSTGLPIATDVTIDVYCRQCRLNAHYSLNPTPPKPRVLGTIAHYGDKPLLWEYERLSDRTEIGAPYTWGLHPRGGYEVLGWTDDQALYRLGYPNSAMYQRDAARVAQLAKEGIRAFDFWPTTFFAMLRLGAGERSPTRFLRHILTLAQEAERLPDHAAGQPKRPTRAAATSLADGIHTRCRLGHSHNITRTRLVQLLQSPALQGTTLYLPHK